MRHRKSGRQLNRNSSHRKAMFSNMATSLFDKELIRTTLPKAKELRSIAEPLITLSKNDSVSNRRLAFAKLRDRDIVTKLFNELGPRYQERPGGYLRIMKCGFRTGDKAPMAYVELVDRPELEEAESQIRDYLSELKTNITDYQRRGFPYISADNVRGLILIGRSSKMGEEEIEEFKKIRARAKDYEIITFDELFERVKTFLENLGIRFSPFG